MTKDRAIKSDDRVKVKTDFTLQGIGEKLSLAGWLDWLIGLALALHKDRAAQCQYDPKGLV